MQTTKLDQLLDQALAASRKYGETLQVAISGNATHETYQASIAALEAKVDAWDAYNREVRWNNKV